LDDAPGLVVAGNRDWIGDDPGLTVAGGDALIQGNKLEAPGRLIYLQEMTSGRIVITDNELHSTDNSSGTLVGYLVSATPDPDDIHMLVSRNTLRVDEGSGSPTGFDCRAILDSIISHNEIIGGDSGGGAINKCQHVKYNDFKDYAWYRTVDFTSQVGASFLFNTVDGNPSDAHVKLNASTDATILYNWFKGFTSSNPAVVEYTTSKRNTCKGNTVIQSPFKVTVVNIVNDSNLNIGDVVEWDGTESGKLTYYDTSTKELWVVPDSSSDVIESGDLLTGTDVPTWTGNDSTINTVGNAGGHILCGDTDDTTEGCWDSGIAQAYSSDCADNIYK
jgi:hypothetical protein